MDGWIWCTGEGDKGDMPTLVSLLKEFDAATNDYDQHKQDLELAIAGYKLAVRYVRVTRERFLIQYQTLPGAEKASLDDPMIPIPWQQRLQRHEYIGLTIAEAARRELQRLKKASSGQIAFGMEERGFDFRTEAHVREVHAVLIKQLFSKRVDQ